MQSKLVCLGCETELPELGASPLAFHCPLAPDDPTTDHILVRRFVNAERRAVRMDETNPYLRFRDFDHVYLTASAAGLSDNAYADLVRKLDAAISRVDGHGFSITPQERQVSLEMALGFSEPGGLWVKNETVNVSGSHKARHLFSVLMHLECIRQLGLADVSGELVIASCGNAALAAATLARAAERSLRVFVPEDAEPSSLERMRNLGAQIEICTRRATVLGDPTVHRFRESLRNGSIPFSCQGPDQALAVQGGKTLAWEMIHSDELPLDRVLVQVGGGALASSLFSAYEEAQSLGHIRRLPRLHAVQTRGCYPLVRAYQRLVDDLQRRHGWQLTDDAEIRAMELRDKLGLDGINAEIRRAARNRSSYMEPWSTVPHSIAHGILDDETYDWLPVVRGMLLSAGYPILIDEPDIKHALYLGRSCTGINVCATGASSLAGLCVLLTTQPHIRRERVGVLFTGRQR
ncbi:MAG TPA: pyridoxal-phosphate dependent enzyme [Polyangium sp.]|nr:pyridoxal-phosphate dependent enzyme [Polyangium sp.]